MNSVEDGRIRTGTLWTGVAHAFTASIGTGVLALPWSMAQLGWILGTFILITFAMITYFTAARFVDCYRSPDPVHGARNRTYRDAVKAILGPKSVTLCGIFQYSFLWCTMIGYTISIVISIAAMKRTACHSSKGPEAKCEIPGHLYMLLFGGTEVILSQFPNLEKITILSIIATITSFLYSFIVIGLSTAKLSSSGFHIKGSLSIAHWGNKDLSTVSKVWNVFQALGNIAFSYSYNTLLLEIQDTLKSPPPENEVMKRVSLYATSATAVFYFFVACTGYAAYGDQAPGNIIKGLYNVVWLIEIANLSVIIHVVGGYQVFAQPIFALHEKWLATKYPTSILNKIYTIKLKILHNITVQFTLAKLLLRTIFVLFTTLVAMMFPFFNAILSLIGAACFWPLTVYFPLTMYTVQAKIKKGSFTWIMFQVLGVLCFAVTVMAAVGSIGDIVQNRRRTKFFHFDQL